MNYSPKRARSKGIVVILLLLVFSLQVHATGQLQGEHVLDTDQNYKTTNSLSTAENALYFLPGGVAAIEAFSILRNTFNAQQANKDAGLNQNIEIDVAKKNLDNSKQNVTTMFFFIVATFIVLFDAITSIIYIAMFLMFVWLIFVGYAKFMIFLINAVYGRVHKWKKE